MEDRSINIIFIIKRYGDDAAKMIARYMSIECGSPIDCYTASVLRIVVMAVFLDYIRHSPVIRTLALMDIFLHSDGDDLTRMMIALGGVPVRTRDGCYIQGFRDPTFDFSLLEDK